jgi:hypothetical protein
VTCRRGASLSADQRRIKAELRRRDDPCSLCKPLLGAAPADAKVVRTIFNSPDHREPNGVSRNSSYPAGVTRPAFLGHWSVSLAA